ncbi:hypothetical protein [Cobetia amphilecti]
MKKPRQLAMIAAWRGFLVSVCWLRICLLAEFAARGDQPRRF